MRTETFVGSLLLGGLSLWVASRAAAQCPEPWSGNEPEDFTHYVDRDGDGRCDRDGNGELVVLFDAGAGVYPNGFYPSCDVDGDGRVVSGTDQVGHGHWEYSHRQQDPRAYGGPDGETEEKDYFTLPQAMERDFEDSMDAGRPVNDQSRESFEQTMRFALNEPVRFDRAVRPSANPTGRYWQVDEWIGPGSDRFGPAPGLTWTERFFTCFSDPTASPSEPARELSPCATVGGKAAVGGYWSTERENFDVADCGEATGADPDPGRDERCGFVFRECP
jgi:hypothetical protein